MPFAIDVSLKLPSERPRTSSSATGDGRPGTRHSVDSSTARCGSSGRRAAAPQVSRPRRRSRPSGAGSAMDRRSC